MKAFILSLFILSLTACDMGPPKGHDRGLQQQQEKMKEDKNQDIEHLDREMQEDEARREVKSETYYKDIKFTPANN